MLQTVDLVGLLVDQLRETSTISNVVKAVNIYTFITADLKSLAVNDELIFPQISATQLFKIKTIDVLTNKFTVESTTNLSTVTYWKAASPFYYYGTPLAVNNEFLLKEKSRGIFIFLFELLNQKIDNDVNSSIDFDVQLDMYFMKYSQVQDWTTENHYRNVIDKTQEIVFSFIDVLNNDSRVYRPSNISNPLFADWGTFLKDKGFTDRILDQHFSGSGLNFTLPIKKITSC